MSFYLISAALIYTKLYSFIHIYVLMAFNWGVCSYIIRLILCNILFLKNMVKNVFFLVVDNIFWFMEW